MKRSRTKSKSIRHSYDIESGTREALAYDSLKSVNSENVVSNHQFIGYAMRRLDLVVGI